MAIILLLLASNASLFAQNEASSAKEKRLNQRTEQRENLPPVQIDFLSSYYQQDGNNSAITGGLGTEALKEFASTLVIYIPLTNDRDLNLSTGFSAFTSASGDNIDPTTISSASKRDVRVFLNSTISKFNESKKITGGFGGGLSHEMHFMSMNAGAFFQKNFPEIGLSWKIATSYNFDLWAQYYPLQTLYPRELKFRVDPLSQKTRHTLDVQSLFTQIINENNQIAWSFSVINQFGMLSTPYHRVIFKDNEGADIERFPSTRFRIPISFKWNSYVNDIFILKNYTRYYYDTYDIHAISFQTDWLFRTGSDVTVFPYYRLHWQEASKYFYPNAMADVNLDFYSSDFDISGFISHQIGMGFKYAPLSGIGKWDGVKKNNNDLLFNLFELRTGYYRRNTNSFQAWMVSARMSFDVR